MADTPRCPWCGMTAELVQVDDRSGRWCCVGVTCRAQGPEVCEGDDGQTWQEGAIATLADVKREHPVLESAVAYAAEQRARANAVEHELDALRWWVEILGARTEATNGGRWAARIPALPGTSAFGDGPTRIAAIVALYDKVVLDAKG